MSVRPDGRHALLLEAILSPPERSRRAIERWKPGVDVRRLDHPSADVIALLSPRLDPERDAGVLAQVRAVERSSWLRGQALVARVRPVVQTLREEGHAPVLLKGPALAHHAGTTTRTRPMDDVDVLVDPGRLREAVLVAERHGFRSPVGARLCGPDRVVQMRSIHGVPFRDGVGANLDLHWRITHGPGRPEEGRLVRAAAVPAAFCGVPVRVSSRADTLVHVALHRSAHFDALRWVTDAAALCAGEGPDWTAVVARADRFGAGSALADVLRLLAELEAPTAPEDVVAALEAQRPRGALRPLHRVARRPTPLGARATDVLHEVGAGARRPGTGAALLAAGRLEHGLRRRPRRDLEPVALGRVLLTNLRPDGSHCPWLVAGWQASEPEWTWTSDSRARIVLPLAEPSDRALHLEVLAHAMLGPRRPRLEVDVHEGGERIATWSLHGERPEIEVLRLWLAPRPGRRRVDLRLGIRTPRTAEEAGMNREQRRFGLAVRHLLLRDAAAV